MNPPISVINPPPKLMITSNRVIPYSVKASQTFVAMPISLFVSPAGNTTISASVNTSNVVTNFEDPSLQNVPENFLLTINPGINYGTEYLDLGLSVNNLALYNFESSELIQNNQQQSVQAHFMYKGYMDIRGFFDESKFTGLVRSDFQKDETIISALAMVTVPKGIWAQVGYNTLYGASGGVGLILQRKLQLSIILKRLLAIYKISDHLMRLHWLTDS